MSSNSSKSGDVFETNGNYGIILDHNKVLVITDPAARSDIHGFAFVEVVPDNSKFMSHDELPYEESIALRASLATYRRYL